MSEYKPWLASGRSLPLRLASVPLYTYLLGHGQSFLLLPLNSPALPQIPPIVNVVRLHGTIGVGSPLRPPLTAKDLDPLLERAFTKNIAAVALSVNSPGGSPVQSALIHSRIRALAAEYKDSRLCLLRGCGRVRRLLAGLRRR